MKKILVLSTVYPAPDIPKGYTPVVHYFAREWVKMGFDVRVINYDINFPRLYYTITSPINKIVASKLGCVIKNKPVRDLRFEMDGVCVNRIVMTKYIPHSQCGKREINKAYEKSVNFLKHENFVPNVIICHWANPCLQLMAMLKSLFCVPTCFVSHGIKELNVFGEKAKEILKTVDIVGCRSEYIRKEFERVYSNTIPTFNCYSGIPAKYVNCTFQKKVNEIRTFIYVGTLISRKFPSAIIPALSKSFGDVPFSIHYIGEGNERKAIEKEARKYSVIDKVHLHGRMQRDQVVEFLDKSDVFIMISKNEAFGLVYLEAMARGCITIASRREGFDGIIKDGVNGFLCESGNSTELSSIITRIRAMSIEELQLISDNAIKTACELTDNKAARIYIDNIEQIIKDNSRLW